MCGAGDGGGDLGCLDPVPGPSCPGEGFPCRPNGPHRTRLAAACSWNSWSGANCGENSPQGGSLGVGQPEKETGPVGRSSLSIMTDASDRRSHNNPRYVQNTWESHQSPTKTPKSSDSNL